VLFTRLCDVLFGPEVKYCWAGKNKNILTRNISVWDCCTRFYHNTFSDIRYTICRMQTPTCSVLTLIPWIVFSKRVKSLADKTALLRTAIKQENVNNGQSTSEFRYLPYTLWNLHSRNNDIRSGKEHQMFK